MWQDRLEVANGIDAKKETVENLQHCYTDFKKKTLRKLSEGFKWHASIDFWVAGDDPTAAEQFEESVDKGVKMANEFIKAVDAIVGFLSALKGVSTGDIGSIWTLVKSTVPEDDNFKSVEAKLDEINKKLGNV